MARHDKGKTWEWQVMSSDATSIVLTLTNNGANLGPKHPSCLERMQPNPSIQDNNRPNITVPLTNAADFPAIMVTSRHKITVVPVTNAAVSSFQEYEPPPLSCQRSKPLGQRTGWNIAWNHRNAHNDRKNSDPSGLKKFMSASSAFDEYGLISRILRYE